MRVGPELEGWAFLLIKTPCTSFLFMPLKSKRVLFFQAHKSPKYVWLEPTRAPKKSGPTHLYVPDWKWERSLNWSCRRANCLTSLLSSSGWCGWTGEWPASNCCRRIGWRCLSMWPGADSTNLHFCCNYRKQLIFCPMECSESTCTPGNVELCPVHEFMIWSIRA
jgi:hypothetical protein